VELSAFYFCYYYKLLPSLLLKNEGQREASVENECIFRGKTYLNPILAQTNFLSRSRDCPKQTKKDLKTNQLRFITFCSANFGCRTLWNFYLVKPVMLFLTDTV